MKMKGNLLNSFFIMLVCLCLLITSSTAWLANNRDADTKDLGLGLEKNDTSATYIAYRYDLDAEKGTDKTANGEPLKIDNLVLNRYDTIFRVMNKYTPAFAQITIAGNQSMPQEGTMHITVERDAKIPIPDDGAVTSNIVRFSAFLGDSALNMPELADPDKMYSHINDARFSSLEEYKENSSWSKTFVTAVEENGTHEHDIADSITLSVTYSANDWETDDGNPVLIVYLYISYDAELLKCYKEHHSDANLSLNDPSVVCANDFKKIQISYDLPTEDN